MPPFHRGNKAWLWSAASASALLATARCVRVCVCFVGVHLFMWHVARPLVCMWHVACGSRAMWLALWCACGAPSGVHVGNATASTVKYVCVCFCSCACCAQCKMLLRFDVVKDCLSQVLRFACLATQVCVCLSVCLCLCLCLAVCCRNAPRSLSGQVRVCVSLSDI
jgi:hypothetical protein